MHRLGTWNIGSPKGEGLPAQLMSARPVYAPFACWWTSSRYTSFIQYNTIQYNRLFSGNEPTTIKNLRIINTITYKH